MDAAEKKDLRVDQIDKVDIKDADNLTGKYVNKARKMVSKTFAKRALQWYSIDSVFNLCSWFVFQGAVICFSGYLTFKVLTQFILIKIFKPNM